MQLPARAKAGAATFSRTMTGKRPRRGSEGTEQSLLDVSVVQMVLFVYRAALKGSSQVVWIWGEKTAL